MIRYALLYGMRDASQVAVFLPSNYSVAGEAVERHEKFSTAHADGRQYDERFVVVIAGRDQAGWTLDGYVIPRLASGMIFGREIDLSHPVMKAIPERSEAR